MPELQRRILLVEDEESLSLTLRDRFQSEGYPVTVESDGEAALATGTRTPFDLIVLDVMLPRKNGFDVCRELRQRGVQTPMLMLTARGQVVDKVVGLKLGADDYLTKPFEMMELLARVEALLRRARTMAATRRAYASARSTSTSAAPRCGATARRSTVGARDQAAALLHRAPRRRPLARRAARQSVGLRRDADHAHRRRARRLAAPEDGSEPRSRSTSSPCTAWATSSSASAANVDLWRALLGCRAQLRERRTRLRAAKPRHHIKPNASAADGTLASPPA